MCGTHPDHDTICAFRRQNGELLSSSFAQVLELAARCEVLKVGSITVAIDGTKVLANASKHAAVSYARSGQQMQELEFEIEALLRKTVEPIFGIIKETLGFRRFFVRSLAKTSEE